MVSYNRGSHLCAELVKSVSPICKDLNKTTKTRKTRKRKRTSKRKKVVNRKRKRLVAVQKGPGKTKLVRRTGRKKYGRKRRR